MSATKHEMSVPTALWVLRIARFFGNFMPALAVIVLIYTQKGVTVGDFFLIEGIFRLAAFLLEIPSGYLSDRFSRRRVLMLAALLHGAGFAVLALAYGFWEIVAGEVLLGIASALFSGTLEAYTYDLLKRNNTQKHFLKEMGSITTWISAANFIATLIGPKIYVATNNNGNLLIWITAILAFVEFTLFYRLPELTEVIRHKQKGKSAFMDAVGITYKTMNNPKLRSLIVFPALFGSFTIIMLWILQPIMQLSHVPVVLFGVYVSANMFARIIFSKYAYKICEWFGEIKTAALTILALTVGIAMSLVAIHTSNMTVVYIAIAIMALVPALVTLNNLQYNTLIHHDIESKERGTVLSTRAMVSTLFSAISLSTTKYLYDYYGADITMLTLLFATVLLVISLKQTMRYMCCSSKQQKIK